MPRYRDTDSFVVGQSQTNPIIINENSLLGLVVAGSSISGSLISFLVSTDGVTYYPLFDSTNTEVTLTVSSTTKAYSLNHEAFEPWNYVKARLGTSASAKLQAGVDTPLEFTYGPSI
jgi:hypothetical protein